MELLSDKYPCLICEDSSPSDVSSKFTLEIRLIFLTEEDANKFILDYTIWSDFLEQYKDLFIIFEAWSRFNLKNTFTAHEVKFLFKYLVSCCDLTGLDLVD